MALIKNTIILGILIFFYYMSLMLIGWINDTIFGIGILGTASSIPTYASTLWNFVLWVMFPVCIIIGFIVLTRPRKAYYLKPVRRRQKFAI